MPTRSFEGSVDASLPIFSQVYHLFWRFRRPTFLGFGPEAPLLSATLVHGSSKMVAKCQIRRGARACSDYKIRACRLQAGINCVGTFPHAPISSVGKANSIDDTISTRLN